MRYAYPKIIAVEGIIGAGKTTFLSKLQYLIPQYRIEIISEPVKTWENVLNFKFSQENILMQNKPNNINYGQFDLLYQMYEDVYRWSFSFQLWTLLTRCKLIDDVLNGCINEKIDLIVIERSLTSNYIFASIMQEKKYLNECEWLMYNAFFDHFNQHRKYTLDGIMYLQCPVNLAMNRINLRNRRGELNINFDYQELLRIKHDQWLLNDNLNLPLLCVKIPYEDKEKSLRLQLNDFIRNIL